MRGHKYSMMERKKLLEENKCVSKKELASSYGISYPTLMRMIDGIDVKLWKDDLGSINLPKKGKLIYPRQLKVIVNHLG